MTHLTHTRSARLLLGLAFSAGFAVFIGAQLAVNADEKKDAPGFVEKMKQWQDKMSDTFRDTWNGWRGSKAEQSLAAASIDLREQHDTYTVRLNLPNRDLDKVDIRLDGSSLRIVAPASKDVGRYEQLVDLEKAATGAVPQIARKQAEQMIVVTVPKAPNVAAAKPSDSSKPLRDLSPLDPWDTDVFARMEKMRRDMDRIFDESFKSLRSGYDPSDFFDRPRFGSSLDLQEEGGNYVVRAYLPDRKMENVNVSVEGQTLKIEAKAEETAKKEDQGVTTSQRTHYAQMITLPGPVKAEKMTVDKKEAMVVVTLPKA